MFSQILCSSLKSQSKTRGSNAGKRTQKRNRRPRRDQDFNGVGLFLPPFRSAFKDEKAKLKSLEEFYRTLTRSSQICFFVTQDGKFVFTNPKGEEESGYSKDEIIGLDAQSFIHPEDQEKVRERLVKMLKGEISSPIEFRYVNKSGQVRWAMGIMTPITYEGCRAALGNYVDITERKLAEVELEHSRQQLRDLTAHLQSVREEERTRIARDS